MSAPCRELCAETTSLHATGVRNMKEALFLVVLSLFVTKASLKPTRELEIWESPCGSSNVSLNLDLFLTPTQLPNEDNSQMLRSCVVVFREARAAIRDAKDIFKKDILLSKEEALQFKDANGSAVGLNFNVLPRTDNVVSDINSDYSFVSAAILYIEDIKIRGKSTQIYSHMILLKINCFHSLCDGLHVYDQRVDMILQGVQPLIDLNIVSLDCPQQSVFFRCIKHPWLLSSISQCPSKV
uniref:Uncharacterized protein n=1 Tax=Magallana gigas TaxID=29159 RepID=K1QM46_MAGGI